ncbi:TetR family transcriptional regulator [filamentous cyanobacterium CCP1]|nr:TetR family transcriptional regulator [filamentous cyanobacterium CCP2]PSB61373.1 TetR family transcriptional regulator [filamentous cyanobacterium CCP1]
MTKPARSTSDRTDKREVILQAALELFAEFGFHGTPMPLVAERANVGAGTIYRYFDSKEALANAVYQRAKLLLYETLVKDFPEDLPARQQFHVFWQRLINFAIENPLAFQFLEFHDHVSYLDESSQAVAAKLWEPGCSFFEKTNQQQITKPMPPKLLIAIVWGMFTGIVKVSYRGHFELDPEVIAQTERACWEAVRY